MESGYRPGASSAVPAGLKLKRLVLTQTVKPLVFQSSTARLSRALIQSMCPLFMTKRPDGVDLACAMGRKQQSREHHDGQQSNDGR
jgi:hypothetical protein